MGTKNVAKIGATRVAACSFMTPVFVIFLGVSVGFVAFEWTTLPGIALVLTAMRFIQKE